MDQGRDEDAYRRYLDGDDSAFDQILHTYFGPLTFFSARIVHDTDAAQDIAVDTLLELIIHKKRYRFGSSMHGYLFTIAHNRSVNYVRRQAKRGVSLPEGSEEWQKDEITLEEQIIADERKRMLSRAIDRLPKDMAEALHLFYYEDFSYEEIAKTMKKSKKQIDNLLYRAKAELKQMLGKEGEEIDQIGK